MMMIKRRYLCITICLLISFCFLSGCKKNKGLTKVTLSEVAHSVFYAPQYVALDQGYFEEEGLEIELLLGNGADKVTSGLLSKDVDIGLMGPEPTIYLYNNGADELIINFLQLTTTDGSFIFGREKDDDFTIMDLKGKSILGGRDGGVPEMTLEYVIKKAGLTLERNGNSKDVNVRTDVAFGAMAGSFISGEGDYTTLFEPTASEMVLSNELYLLASVGELAGEITYTGYCASESYIKNHADILEKFTRAIYKGQIYVDTHTDEEVAKCMISSFKDQTLETLTHVVKRYREINAFAKTPLFSETGFDNLQNIMIEAGHLDKKVPFSVLVNNEIATKILEEKA